MGAASVVAAGGFIIPAKFGKTEVSAIATELESSVSQHTGNRLRRFRLVFRAYEPEQKKAIEDSAHSGTRVHLGPDEETDESKWILGDHSYHYRDDEPLVTYIWTIAEEEHFRIDRLEIDEMSFCPHRYEEQFDGPNTLRIDAYLRVSADEWKRLQALSRYFRVVRHGINETPSEMRLGQVLWSSTDDVNLYKLRVVLVDRRYDELHPDSHGFLDPFQANTEILLAESSLLTDQLLEALISKGVLSRTEIDIMRKTAKEKIPEKRREFDRVGNVDEW
jgi:hypothetical protein